MDFGPAQFSLRHDRTRPPSQDEATPSRTCAVSRALAPYGPSIRMGANPALDIADGRQFHGPTSRAKRSWP